MKNKMSYLETEQKKIAQLVTKRFKNFYLTGGTALSFYFRHRASEDLDFFTQRYRREDPDKVMKFVSEKTGFYFRLEAEQDNPKLIPMKVYSLQLKRGQVLKVDIVRDYHKNFRKVKNGLHSIEDIYFRKIMTAVGHEEKESETGAVVATGRQTAKDLYDLYFLSWKFKPLSEIFLDYLSPGKAERLIAWYRSFNRLDLKLELMDLVPKVDTGLVLRHLDGEILKKLPDKLIG